MTSLMVACEAKNMAAAAELLEATKKAGALDLQVTEQTWFGVCGVRGEARGRKEEGRGAFAQGTDRCVYVPLQGTSYCTYKRSALHYASSSGLESIVAKLLSLGANAALKDAVRACSYMNTCMCISPYVFMCME